jgi:GTP 3',8-cyclase
VQRGLNDHTLVELAQWAKDRGFTLRFIEFMDVGNQNGWKLDHVVPAREIVERVHAALPLEKLPRNYHSETALRFRYQDGGGEIGVIASVTQPFCGDCSRMRLSADGKFYTCLFATEGTDVKSLLRGGASDDDVIALITRTWDSRTDRYSEQRHGDTPRHKIEMFYIGG